MESWLPHPVNRIFPEILSGPIDMFFLIAAALFLMICISVVKVSPELAHCICWMLPLLLNTDEYKYSDTSANKDNSFRNHIR